MSGRVYSQELFDTVLNSKPPKFMPTIRDDFMPEFVPLKGWTKFKVELKWFLGWRYLGCVGLWKFFTNGKKNKFILINAVMPDLCVHELVIVQPMTRKFSGWFRIKYVYPPFKREWSCITGLRFK
jgi:hypothetical protein